MGGVKQLKNVLLILVGGTICTKADENGVLSIDAKAGVKLKNNYLNSNSSYVKDVHIELTDNMNILSENMTVDRWNDIIALYREKVLDKKYDGIIFAHGTDTLSFSSSLFSILLADTDIPVFFVSANEKLDSPRTNGNENFRYAIENICRGILPNVYVIYKNLSDNQMYLHLASRLKMCENYSEDFYSEGSFNITNINDDNYGEYFKKLESEFPKEKMNPLISIRGDWKLSNCILLIRPYVGLSYDVFNFQKFSAILHGTYHSGTLCAKDGTGANNSILSMIDLLLDNHCLKDIYVSPSKIYGEVYETIPFIANYRKSEINIEFLYGSTLEATYAKLLIAYSIFENKKDIIKFLNEEINFEKAYM